LLRLALRLPRRCLAHLPRLRLRLAGLPGTTLRLPRRGLPRLRPHSRLALRLAGRSLRLRRLPGGRVLALPRHSLRLPLHCLALRRLARGSLPRLPRHSLRMLRLAGLPLRMAGRPLRLPPSGLALLRRGLRLAPPALRITRLRRVPLPDSGPSLVLRGDCPGLSLARLTLLHSGRTRLRPGQRRARGWRWLATHACGSCFVGFAVGASASRRLVVLAVQGLGAAEPAGSFTAVTRHLAQPFRVLLRLAA